MEIKGEMNGFVCEEKNNHHESPGQVDISIYQWMSRDQTDKKIRMHHELDVQLSMK